MGDDVGEADGFNKDDIDNGWDVEFWVGVGAVGVGPAEVEADDVVVEMGGIRSEVEGEDDGDIDGAVLDRIGVVVAKSEGYVLTPAEVGKKDDGTESGEWRCRMRRKLEKAK